MLGSVRFLLVCTSRRRWPHRSDVGTEYLPPTTVPETFGGALSGAGRCGQTGFVSVSISLYTPIFLSFLLLLFGQANTESQLNDKEQTVLLKLKQHWQNPPSLSHWQNPPSPCHLNSLNSSHHCNWPEITCTNGLVTQLLLQNKNINETVPPFICDLKKLTVIDLSYKFISQEFPKSLYNCSKLEELDLSQNYFNGTIPVDIHSLSCLRRLHLGANSFYGNIPSSIGQLTELRTFQLFQCAFNGSFPREIGNLFKLESLQLAYNVNMTAAELPSSFTELKKLKFLWIKASNLNGEIPETIGEMEALVHLDLSINSLTGKIPSSLFMLKNLGIVYLFGNRLSGEISRVVEALNIDVIDLSDNKLTGSIPDDFGRLRNMTGLSLFFNQLSGKIPDSFDHRKPSKVPSKYLPLIISFVAAALLSLVVAMICIYRKGKHGLDSTWKFTTFQRVNFRESDILSGLTEKNVIGSGGSGKVYRVVVNDSNNFVAVKRIWNNRKLEQKVEKEFHAEVKILGSIRHSNIVKLLCCMSNGNSKLLAYEYSENHSLDQWLHRKSRSSTTSSSVHHVVLDWPKRLRIADGLAQGLYYMHHVCSPPIVHRDVKSSNILLDSEFNAKIAGFGVAKMFNQGELVPGPGEIDPAKIDVYNFGVILLELATGREANDGDEHTFLAKWALDHILHRIPIVDALDEEVLIPGYLEEMSSIFILGVICTNTQPSIRPSMKELLQILPLCTEFLPSSSVQTTRMCQEMSRIFWEKMLQEYDVAACRICFENS